jgi:integrase/recombinase XerD
LTDDNNNNVIAASAKYDNRGYYRYGDSYSEERKINLITEGLEPRYSNLLVNISKENAIAIVDFVLNINIEVNLSDNHKRNYISLLSQLSKFYHNKKSFKEMSKQDILLFLDSFRKSENSDPLHKWIGTYNQYTVLLIKFFKWLYYPDIEPHKRIKPQVVENIFQLRRKEQSIYKPTDLWTREDDLLFLRYCPSKRDKCYHMISRDTGCRPHEILKLRLKDITFKTAGGEGGGHQYAEVLVNGKTGSRHIPLIDSIPFVKDWMDEHPQQGNLNAPLICGYARSIGRRLKPKSLNRLYGNYKKGLFTKLVATAAEEKGEERTEDVPEEDKQKIRELLKKPWNPYIRRHSALTEKSVILKEHVLRQYAGWSIRSQMPQKYLHYFGNESSESILQAYGIITKENQDIDKLRPKQCPNCNEPNKPDSKFCAKCRMVLTYDAYSETIESAQQKDDEIKTIKQQIQALILAVSSMKDQNQVNNLTHQLFNAGILQVSKSSPNELSSENNLK